MRASRRSVLKAGALAVASVAAPGMAKADRRVIIYDSRLPESAAFAAKGRAAVLIDIAHAEAEQWRTIRTLGRVPVSGLTGWSDWVSLRGLFEERGLRVRSEAAVHAPVSGRAHLFRWDMA